MKSPEESLEGWKWWREAWYDTQGARLEFFIVGLILIVVAMVVGMLGGGRGVLGHFMVPFLQFAAFEFSRLWRTKKQRDFKVLWLTFRDQALVKRLLPLALVSGAVGLVSWLCLWLADKVMWFGAIRFFIDLVTAAAFIFAVPLVAKEGKKAIPALRESLETVYKHGQKFVIFFGVALLSILAGLCSLGIGFVFLLPLYVYLPYLIYTRFSPSLIDKALAQS